MLEPNRTRLASASRGRYAAAYKSFTAAHITHFAITVFDTAPQRAANAHPTRTSASSVAVHALDIRGFLYNIRGFLDTRPASLDRNGARVEEALSLVTSTASDTSTVIDFGRFRRTYPTIAASDTSTVIDFGRSISTHPVRHHIEHRRR